MRSHPEQNHKSRYKRQTPCHWYEIHCLHWIADSVFIWTSGCDGMSPEKHTLDRLPCSCCHVGRISLLPGPHSLRASWLLPAIIDLPVSVIPLSQNVHLLSIPAAYLSISSKTLVPVLLVECVCDREPIPWICSWSVGIDMSRCTFSGIVYVRV